MLKGETKHKAQWKLVCVMSNVIGKDGTVCVLKLKLGNGYVVERPLQLECDLNVGGEDPEWRPNLEAEVFTPRAQPSRKARRLPRIRLKTVQEVKND